MCKIIFDNVIFSLQKSGGISVVWYELLSRILGESNIVSGFVNHRLISNENHFADKLHIAVHQIIYAGKYRFKYYRYFPEFLDIQEKFIFHSSYYRICKNAHAINITTVHDFTYEYFFKGMKKNIHYWQKKYAVLNSDLIICISENTKRDLLKFFPKIDPLKIRVIYNGVSDEYNVLPLGNFCIPFPKKTYVLFVGSRATYKQFNLAVQAIASSNFNFVIVGSPLTNEENEYLESVFMDKHRYVNLVYIPNSELNILYNNAYALLYPSEYEGFGIPVLEAQKAGCPVVAYRASSIPEIIGDTPLLINNLTIDELIGKLILLEDELLREEVILNGLKNARRFTWDKTYDEMLKVYIEVWNLKKKKE